MKTIAFVAVLLAALASLGFWVLRDDPAVYIPSDLSDLYQRPDSPVLLSDVSTLENEVVIERDLAVVVRDGTRLSANVFRPKAPGTFPVVMMLTAYHKDEDPTRYPDILRNHLKPEFNLGPIQVSPWTPWEGPDPAYWVQQGYAVVTLDSRGYGKSDGVASILTMQDRQDFHDAITWAGSQDWSNGNVGLTGVSYLAIAQWVAGSNAPKHLKAIMPWEGQSDNFREVLFHGGIPETAFTAFWLDRMRRKANESSLPPSFAVNFAGKRPMVMKWLQQYVMPPSGISLPDITVPALIAASWSDHGLHTRGSFEGFKKISSEQKWLYTHGRSKWPVYYSADARSIQTAFFDHFLKGLDNGFDKSPRVRLEVRDGLETYTVRSAEDWPLPETVYRPFYLVPGDGSLQHAAPSEAGSVQYDAMQGNSVFRVTFDEQTEIIGNMKLRLWVEAHGASDMDLFVAIKKYDVMGNEVTFYGKAGYTGAPVALGWLRASHRALDVERSTPAQPVLSFESRQTLSRGEIVSVEIEILPSSTRFQPGETLEVAIQGRDHFDHPSLAHKDTVNTGTHIIHAGGSFDSHLLVPIFPKRP